MVAHVSIVSTLHNQTSRDYMARVTDKDYPKYRAAELAKLWDFDYWDGDRRICYGGYYYRPGYWKPVAEKLIELYGLHESSTVLDIGCGKGFLLYELVQMLPGLSVKGVDISRYAKANSHPEVSNSIIVGTADNLPFGNQQFDLAISLNTFHNLYNYQLDKALSEMMRVSRNSYLCVESYRNELEKQNLLYWQVTCEMFCTPDEWNWWFKKCGYNRDYEFIFFK